MRSSSIARRKTSYFVMDAPMQEQFLYKPKEKPCRLFWVPILINDAF